MPRKELKETGTMICICIPTRLCIAQFLVKYFSSEQLFLNSKTEREGKKKKVFIIDEEIKYLRTTQTYKLF